MIAKNFIRYPEALRFQREMFSNGYHNSPRIMRLMEVVFDWTPSTPQWVKDAKARAKNLVKAWRSHMLEMFETMKTKAKKIDPRQLELVLFPDHEPKGNWMDDSSTATPQKFPPNGYFGSDRWNICLTVEKADWSWGDGSEWLETEQGGRYKSFCRRHQGGFQGHARTVGSKTAYAAIVTCNALNKGE